MRLENHHESQPRYRRHSFTNTNTNSNESPQDIGNCHEYHKQQRITTRYGRPLPAMKSI
ncbi:hypothetical protein BVRB_1g011290 [Beta vulgaris subsp. vulgaris]|nr:hypothetical protein BVRB_1g011290 [Beta vulgaris subsp. vulgaris]